MSVELCVPNPRAVVSSLGGGSAEEAPQVDISIETKSEERHVDIIDIRNGRQPLDLAPAIRAGLQHRNEHGHRTLPSLLLWNEQGLKLFEEVTCAPAYYLTDTEIALLAAHSHELARQIEPGSGSLRKTRLLLQAVEALGKRVDYYALDLGQLFCDDAGGGRHCFEHVRCHGLHGTYDDGQVWIARPENADRPRCILSLGSTLGSLAPSEAAAFLKTWAEILKAGSGSRVIIGLDGCKDAAKVFAAYNDPGGANRRFIFNALDSANAHLGYEAFRGREWTKRGEWDAEAKRHVQYLVALREVDVPFLDDEQQQQQQQQVVPVTVKAGEKVEVGSSYKFDDEAKERLWKESGLRVARQFVSEDRSYAPDGDV
ncbi:hypothetical protein PG994_007046 [Apiospora phragmitis]|uniref:4-dimethylallyltryptophan N-methyltransferase n=1 Tax=Apiospora phragmitis TaxID=2905665 RepID=A0ABR1UZN2_9PEZI